MLLPYSGLFPWGANFLYFRGSPGCHEILHPQNFFTPTFYIHVLKFGPVTFCYDFVMTLFCYLRPIDYALDPQDTLSQAVPCVIAEEVNREVQKAEARPTETGPVPLVQ